VKIVVQGDATNMTTLIEQDLLTDTLRSLPGWEGGPERIWRTIRLDTELDGRLREAVAEAAESMDHHPVLEDDGGATRYVLWTHDAGGVTELDIALASRISNLIHQLSGQEGVQAVREGDSVIVVRSTDEAGPREGGSLDTASVGVASSTNDSTHVPLPDAAPFAPEPGASPEQAPGQL